MHVLWTALNFEDTFVSPILKVEENKVCGQNLIFWAATIIFGHFVFLNHDYSNILNIFLALTFIVDIRNSAVIYNFDTHHEHTSFSLIMHI